MMKYFAGAISALFFGWLVVQAVQTAPTQWQKIVDLASVEVVQDGSCSGVLVAENTVLTASHCITVGKEDEFLTVNVQGKEYIARVNKINRDSDLALLVIPGVTFKGAVKIAFEQGKILDKVCAIGNPRAILPDTVTCGIISYIDREIKDIKHKLLQVDLSGAPGNSGGGLFNAYGELIGILTNAYATPYEWGGQYVFGTNLKDIKEFLS